MSLEQLTTALFAPAYALPIDLLRILVGVLSLIYFLYTYREARDFSSPHGLIDHIQSLALFPPTRISLFQPGMGLAFFRLMFLAA